MSLFTKQINNWNDWGDIFQSIPTFTPLIEQIFRKENLPVAAVENLTPGTNAVFKVGGYVVKIFIPIRGGGKLWNYGTDVNVELFGMRWANALGVPSPKLIADGVIENKYHFRYMIMEYIHGKLFDQMKDSLTYEQKVIIGHNVRNITDKLNVPCENFTPINVMAYAIKNSGWEDEGFPESFCGELAAYLKNFQMGQKVYCHGDLHGGNIIIDDDMNVFIIDFADAMYAPPEYEQVYVIGGFFDFEQPYMEGYFGGSYDIEDIIELCMKWLPVHAWAHSGVDALKPAAEITSLDVMRERLREYICWKNFN